MNAIGNTLCVCAVLAPIFLLTARAADTRHLSMPECDVAGQVGFAAATVRDAGGVERDEHRKIDSYEPAYPRRELWLVTHDITAFAYQHAEWTPQEVGVAILEYCTGNQGDLSFAAQSEL